MNKYLNKKGVSLFLLVLSMTITSIILMTATTYYLQLRSNIDDINDTYLAYGEAYNKYYDVSHSDYNSVATKGSKNNQIANTPWSYDISVNNTPKKLSSTSGSFKESEVKFNNSKSPKDSFSLYVETMSKDAGYIGNFGEENGYVKLPNGLILQWGRVKIKRFFDSANTGEYVHINFPQKILNAVASISLQQPSTGDAYTIYVQNVTENNAVIVTDSSYYAYPSGYVYWQAIGY